MKCDRWDEARGRQDEDEGFRVTVNIGRSETTEETEEGHKGGHTECRVCVWGGVLSCGRRDGNTGVKCSLSLIIPVCPLCPPTRIRRVPLKHERRFVTLSENWTPSTWQQTEMNDRSTSCSYNTLNALLLLCSISTARPAFRILLKLNVLFISRWTHWTTLSTVN